jgi:hypothetical protein
MASILLSTPYSPIESTSADSGELIMLFFHDNLPVNSTLTRLVRQVWKYMTETTHSLAFCLSAMLVTLVAAPAATIAIAFV